MVSAISLVLFGIVAAVSSQKECSKGYYQSAGSFYDQKPKTTTVEVQDTFLPILLNENLHNIGQPKITGINVYVCSKNDEEPRKMTLTYNNGYLVVEQPSRQPPSTLHIEYVILPMPYAPLSDGWVLIDGSIGQDQSD